MNTCALCTQPRLGMTEHTIDSFRSLNNIISVIEVNINFTSMTIVEDTSMTFVEGITSVTIIEGIYFNDSS